MRLPAGFTFSGLHAGIKANRKDLALVFSDTPCAAAGCFTGNRVKAAPVQDAEERLPAAGVRAVIINSGYANALTGPVGLEDVRALCSQLGQVLGVPAGSVLSASTGVIGHRMPVHKMVAALPALVAELRPEPDAAAEAMMTTDTRVKVASRTLQVDGREVVLSAICKGSGMIHPALATVLAVVTTDCAITPEALALALRAAMGTSFNALTVDGDMSTNDTVYALANGRAGNTPIASAGLALEAFTQALTDLCRQLAREVAADGEGATKLLEVTVTGAPTQPVAQDLARAVAGSNLVKAAMFGADPNWGRVLATVGARAGTQGYAVDPYAAHVAIQGISVFREGSPLPFEHAALKARMREPEVRVLVELSDGGASALAWGCDLSYDYVKLNADYTSQLVQSQDGTVARDNRLSNYSPAFKTSLLVEALSYIARFEGKRCVVQIGGAGMVKESLKRSFCQDMNLLRSAGMLPLVVHGGGPDAARTMEKLGGSELLDAARVGTSDPRMMEMVLTGGINTELVTLLNLEGSIAVGVSGKDGGLLRARRLAGEVPPGTSPLGEVTRVNRSFLEMLLQQGYMPVVSPVALGEDGQSYTIPADQVAAEIAVAVGATKLIYVTDEPGVVLDGELVPQLTAHELHERLASGILTNGMRSRARSVLRALSGGVEQVHVIDGRVPHMAIAELFTDRGVGTLVSRA